MIKGSVHVQYIHVHGIIKKITCTDTHVQCTVYMSVFNNKFLVLLWTDVSLSLHGGKIIQTNNDSHNVVW